MKKQYSFLLICLFLLVLSGCEYLVEVPLPRINPYDENSPVFYFRAIPLYSYSGQSMQYARLVWKWSDDEAHNQGEVLILRKENTYASSLDDTSAVTVYSWNSSNAIEVYNDLGSDQTGNTFCYTMYYTIDGDDKVYERKAAPAVFETQTLDMPCSFAAGIYYNGSSSSFTANPINLMDSSLIIRLRTSRSGSLIRSSPGILIFMRLTFITTFPLIPVSLFNELHNSTLMIRRLNIITGFISDSSTYTTTDQIVIASPTTGGTNTGSTNDFVPIFNYWLDTLEFYGLRVCINSSPGSNTLEVTTDTATDTYFQLSYVGRRPLTLSI